MPAEQQAITLTLSMIADSGHTNTDDIKSYILDYKRREIIEFMRDDSDWSKIVAAKITPIDIMTADIGAIRNGKNQNLFAEITNKILVAYFCNDLIDLDHEIQDYVDSMEGHCFLSDDNADYSAMRFDNLKGAM